MYEGSYGPYLASAKSLMRRSSSLEAASLLLCRPLSKAVDEDILLLQSKVMAQTLKSIFLSLIFFHSFTIAIYCLGFFSDFPLSSSFSLK